MLHSNLGAGSGAGLAQTGFDIVFPQVGRSDLNEPEDGPLLHIGQGNEADVWERMMTTQTIGGGGAPTRNWGRFFQQLTERANQTFQNLRTARALEKPIDTPAIKPVTKSFVSASPGGSSGNEAGSGSNPFSLPKDMNDPFRGWFPVFERLANVSHKIINVQSINSSLGATFLSGSTLSSVAPASKSGKRRGVDRKGFSLSKLFELFGGLFESPVVHRPRAFNIFVNISAYHAGLTYWTILAEGMLTKATQNPGASIDMSVAHFPPTKMEQKAIDSFTGLFTSIIIALGMSFVPAAYVVYVVKERELASKHLQIVSGVDLTSYWISNYLFDFGCYICSAVLCVVMIECFGQDAYSGANRLVVIVNMLLFGLAVIPFSYLFSFFFKSASTAQNLMIMIYIFSGVLMLVLSFIFYTIEETKPYADTVRFFFRVFPNFCLGDTFFYLSLLALINQFTFVGRQGPWDLGISGWNCIFLAAEAVLYFGLVLFLEFQGRNIERFWTKSENPQLDLHGLDRKEDIDVENEKASIQEGHVEGASIRLQGLRRVFANKVAVNDLWFAVPKNQCFGFLGVNGAGKSTTLKMLTGDLIPSRGDALLAGKSVVSEASAVRSRIGYCPQFDAIDPLLTAEEALTFYGRIRGVPEKRLERMVKYLSRKLTLDQDNQHNRPCGGYSGGNKRKLSVGIALIGNPPVVFLDEPSTGMDPVSRRFMWDFISQTMIERAVILTTHSMEECEALCSRIGILVHGRLRCLGSAQHLKNRFGTGFEFLLSVKDNAVQHTRDFVMRSFKDVEEIECYGGSIKYQLGRQEMKLSAIFQLLEDHKESLGIMDYSIGQSTLEQIFIRFASQGDRELAKEQERLEGSLSTP